MGLQEKQSLGELVKIALKALHRTLAVAVHILTFGRHIQRAVLLHCRNICFGGTLHIAEIFIHSVLAHVYVLHGAQCVAGLVGAGILGQQLVKHLESVIIAVGIIVYQAHVQQRGFLQRILWIAVLEVFEIEQCHVVVVAHQIGVAHFKQGLGSQRRVIEPLEYLVQIGQLFVVFAHSTIRQRFLVCGIIGVGVVGLNHTVVIFYCLSIFAFQVVAVAQTVVHIVHLMLVYRPVGQSQEHLEVVGGIGHLISLHANIPVGI